MFAYILKRLLLMLPTLLGVLLVTFLVTQFVPARMLGDVRDRDDPLLCECLGHYRQRVRVLASGRP